MKNSSQHILSQKLGTLKQKLNNYSPETPKLSLKYSCPHCGSTSAPRTGAGRKPGEASISCRECKWISAGEIGRTISGNSSPPRQPVAVVSLVQSQPEPEQTLLSLIGQREVSHVGFGKPPKQYPPNGRWFCSHNWENGFYGTLDECFGADLFLFSLRDKADPNNPAHQAAVKAIEAKFQEDERQCIAQVRVRTRDKCLREGSAEATSSPHWDICFKGKGVAS